ncbi:ABC transporter permease [Desulfovibrio sulfodismutans]|uniref:ABC transporter permease n=3 Tax=Desulfolutivibrio TaxID=2773294 RepID=A0A7K3NJS6_9BACT|nr:ABC transporter permease [Desulfolutivibrio sulfodismutans]NDY56430.1 ABC transporter permease [Desulfolutivibrio sulfodismutans]QLA14563.1 ABC transporter permease subunit [Desulfolutivibrio sulfodismutans DSM 3696]
MWLFLLIVLPHLDLFIMSFRAKDEYGQMGFSLQNYANFFAEPIYWLTFVRTAIYSVITTVFTFLLAMPVAFYIVKVVRPKYKGFLMVLLLLPFWVSELVRVYGWMILLRESGVVNFFLLKLGIVDAPLHMLYTDATMIMGLVYTSMLFMVVPVISVLESLDDSLIEAASDLGGSKISIWREIILPHCKPGITSGAIVVFMLSLGNYLTPNLMGGKNSLWFTEQIYNQFIASFNWNQGAAFGFLLLLLSSLIIWAGLKISRQKLGEVAS